MEKPENYNKGLQMSKKQHVDSYGKLNELLSAIYSGRPDLIDKAKLDFLWETGNLFGVVTNYLFLNKIGVHFDFGSGIIEKGTELYRIREYKKDTDFSNPKEWTPPPNQSQNRANANGQTALYLGSNEDICYLETHIKPKQQYMLATYKCTDDIKVGGFLTCNSQNPRLTLAGIVLNAFLIAPSRGDKNRELFEYLDSHFGSIDLNNLSSLDEVIEPQDMILPYKFAVLNRKNNLYDITNKLCEALTNNYPDGIGYSSCYIPLETPDIVCSHHNIVLYPQGINKVRFDSCRLTTCQIRNSESFSDVNLAKILISTAEQKNNPPEMRV